MKKRYASDKSKQFRVLYVKNFEGKYKQSFSVPCSLITAQGLMTLDGALEIVRIEKINYETEEWLINRRQNGQQSTADGTTS